LPFAPRLGFIPSGYRLPLVKALYRGFPRGETGLVVRSATAGSLVRSSAIALLRGMLANMLLGLMMADHAAGSSPQKAMMTGIMPCDPADHRTFQTAGGGRWGRV